MDIAYEDKMREAVKAIEKHGLEYAEAKPLANHLDELKKTILSEQIMKHQDLPAWKAEAEARISKEYMIHLEGLKAAEHKANVAWAKMESAKAKFEALRSLLSYEKTQMKVFQE